MKLSKALILIGLIIFFDQWLKIWIKTPLIIGDEIPVTDWFIIHFPENEGMAFGMKLPGVWGKLFLSVFRLAAGIGGFYYLNKIVLQKAHWGFITAVSLILAGALGNMIDGTFYGMIFTDSTYHVAQVFPQQGYAGFMQGHVVDMLWFPIYQGTYPSWFPFWAGEPLEFFRPVFNIADAAITTGVLIILVFNTVFFKEEGKPENSASDQVADTGPTAL